MEETEPVDRIGMVATEGHRHRLKHRLNRNPLDRRCETLKVNKTENRFVSHAETKDIVRKEKIVSMHTQGIRKDPKEVANRKAAKEEKVTVETEKEISEIFYANG